MKKSALNIIQLKITGLYLAFGLLWILFSDRILLTFTDDIVILTQLQTYKGWFFVLITSLFLYILLLHFSKRIVIIMNDLKSAKSKAEESDKLKSAFLANISHEVRTPLNAILGFSELLKDSVLNDQKRHVFLNQVIENGENLLRLMNNIIDVSFIESDQAIADKTSFSVITLLEELQYQNTLLINSKINIQFSIDNKTRPEDDYVVQDRRKTFQILNHLVDNAFKFTVKGKIILTVEKDSDDLIFSLSDTGIGIPANMHSNIFHKFRQVEEGYNRFFGGSGIGLFIANEYTKIIGGTLNLSSEPGIGSIFSLHIPSYSIENKDYAVSGKPQVTDLATKTILIVEDVKSNYEVIEAMLKPTKARLLWAKDGMEALDLFNGNPVDLALVDINLPLLSGIEVCKKIKKNRPSFPVILQTAFSLMYTKEDESKSGCDLLLEKPINRKELLKGISNCLKY
jgi:signal transduction histidine kinase